MILLMLGFTVPVQLELGGSQPIAAAAPAQPLNTSIPTITWNYTFEDAHLEILTCGVETPDKKIAIVGYSSAGSGERDMLFLQLTPTGELDFYQRYGGTGVEYGLSLTLTEAQGIALAGYTSSYGLGVVDGWVLMLDANGGVQWNKTYGTPYEDIINCIIQTQDGGFALGGRSYDGRSGKGWIVKTDPEGEPQWSYYYGETRYDEIKAMTQLADGSIIFAGSCVPDLEVDRQVWLGRVDANGTLLWEKDHGIRLNERANALIQTTDGNLLVVGYTQTNGTHTNPSNFLLLKVDAQGEQLWAVNYGGPALDQAYSVVETDEGELLVLGWTESFGHGYIDYWLLKTDKDGQLLWNQTYGTADDEEGFSLVKTSDGGFVMIGYITVIDVSSYKGFIIKIGGDLSPSNDPFTTLLPIFLLAAGLLFLGLLVLLIQKK